MCQVKWAGGWRLTVSFHEARFNVHHQSMSWFVRGRLLRRLDWRENCNKLTRCSFPESLPFHGALFWNADSHYTNDSKSNKGRLQTWTIVDVWWVYAARLVVVVVVGCATKLHSLIIWWAAVFMVRQEVTANKLKLRALLHLQQSSSEACCQLSSRPDKE